MVCLEVQVLSKIQKLIEKIFRQPTPNDIRYDEMVKLLMVLGCNIQRKTGTSHRHFRHPEFPKVITLMETELVRPYQVNLVRELLKSIGTVQED